MNIPMKRLLACLLCLLPFVSGGAQKFVFTPQWTPQSQFAGYYVALEKGFYREAGLDVEIVHPSPSNSAINRLLSGKSHAVSLQLVQAMQYSDRDTPLVNVLQTSQNSSMMFVSREPLKKSLHSLRGKKVGRWLAGFHEMADVVDKKYGLDIEWIPFVQNINLFVSGAIDATLAMYYNEYFQLLSAGFRFGKENLVFFSDLGYNIPEDGLYVTREYYRRDARRIRLFAQASRRGWEWAAQHPEEALDMVMKQVRLHHVGTNRETQKWMLHEILRAQKERKSGKATFRLSPGAFEQTNRMLLEGGFIRRSISYDQITGRP